MRPFGKFLVAGCGPFPGCRKLILCGSISEIRDETGESKRKIPSLEKTKSRDYVGIVIVIVVVLTLIDQIP